MTDIELHECTRSLKQSMDPRASRFGIPCGDLIGLLDELSALRAKMARPAPNPSILAMVEEHLDGSNIGTELRFRVERAYALTGAPLALTIHAVRFFADGSREIDFTHIVLDDLRRMSRERAEGIVSDATALCVDRVHGAGR